MVLYAKGALRGELQTINYCRFTCYHCSEGLFALPFSPENGLWYSENGLESRSWFLVLNLSRQLYYLGEVSI